MNKLTSLERAVLEALILLNTEDQNISAEDAQILREQLDSMEVSKRNITGAGFFTDFIVSPNARRISNRNKFRISEICADIEDTKDGAGFLLLIKGGVLNQLEGYTMALDKWFPSEGEKFKLKKIVYSHSDANGKYGGKSVDL